MKPNIINSLNFDKYFESLLHNKKEKDIVRGRFDLNQLECNNKLQFIIRLISSSGPFISITYKIFFWESDFMIERFFITNFPEKQYKKFDSYKNGKLPGVLFLDDNVIDLYFLRNLLEAHFNFEMADEPSFNGRVQICLNTKTLIILLDIYDDRGFDIYYKTE